MFSEITLSFYPFARFTVNCVLTHAVGHAEDGRGQELQNTRGQARGAGRRQLARDAGCPASGGPCQCGWVRHLLDPGGLANAGSEANQGVTLPIKTATIGGSDPTVTATVVCEAGSLGRRSPGGVPAVSCFPLCSTCSGRRS